MKLQAAIFDLDGVIVDTAKYHYIAWKELANSLGFDFSETDNERLKGVSRLTSLEILLEIGKLQLPEDRKLELAAQKNERYVSYIEKMNPDEILPGVPDFLNELRAAGIKTAIGSASKNAPLILDRLNLSALFDVVVDGNLVSKAKPHPEVFVKGAEALGVATVNCVVFEDAAAGVEAAHNGGMACIGIGKPENLPNARWVIAGFQHFGLNDLQQLLNNRVEAR